MPNLPAGSYKTYSLAAPLATHWRTGTCEEADCENYAYGWVTKVDESTELGRSQAHYIRHDKTRKATEDREATGLTAFTFPPGQKCFQRHQVALERPPICAVTGGDWRGNPRGERRVHRNIEDWVDDFATHQDQLSKAQE